MDPTRPISAKPVREPGSRAVSRTNPVPDTTRQAGSRSATDVAESVQDASRAIAAGREETRRLDDSSLDALRADYESGRYQVDADALADRMLDDAFGEEEL